MPRLICLTGTKELLLEYINGFARLYEVRRCHTVLLLSGEREREREHTCFRAIHAVMIYEGGIERTGRERCLDCSSGNGISPDCVVMSANELGLGASSQRHAATAHIDTLRQAAMQAEGHD
jgi:hypothetical protein